MSILVQVSELVERSRLDCALPTYGTETLITSAAVLDYVKRAAQKLAAFVQANGADQQYFTLNTTLATVADVAVVSLPVNTLDVQRIAMITDGTNEIMLSAAPLDGWDPSPSFLASLDWAVPRYSIQGNTITLYPTPTSVRTLRVYYTVGFTVTALVDYLALRPFWDEYITACVNILIRARQEKDATEFLRAKAEAEQAIVMSLRRDRAGVHQIRDVREPWPGGLHRLGRWWT